MLWITQEKWVNLFFKKKIIIFYIELIRSGRFKMISESGLSDGDIKE